MAGGGCGFRIGGRTVPVGPLRMRHWAEMEQRLLFLRPTNPIPEVAKVVPMLDDPALAERLIETANADLRSDKARRVVKLSEMMGWINEPDGLAYSAWCCLRETAGPDFSSLEQVEGALADLDRHDIMEFARLRDQISGTDLLANADWPDPNQGVRPDRRERRRQQAEKVFIPWRRVYVTLAYNCAFGPEVIGEMTFYQAKVYMSKPEDVGVSTGDGGGGGSAGTFQANRQTRG